MRIRVEGTAERRRVWSWTSQRTTLEQAAAGSDLLLLVRVLVRYGTLLCERKEEAGAAAVQSRRAYFLGFYFCHSSAFLEDHRSGHVWSNKKITYILQCRHDMRRSLRKHSDIFSETSHHRNFLGQNISYLRGGRLKKCYPPQSWARQRLYPIRLAADITERGHFWLDQYYHISQSV